MSHWINNDFWQAADGTIYDKNNHPVRPVLPPHANTFNAPQHHTHFHDEIHRTQSAQPAAVPPDRRRGRHRHGSSSSRSRSRSREKRLWKLQQEKEQADRDKMIQQAMDEQRRADQEAEDDRAKILAQAKIDEEEKKQERKRLQRQWEEEAKEEKRKEKEQRDRILFEAKREKEEAEEKEKEEERKWELKKKEKELKEKEKKEKEEAEYLERVQRDMAKFGMSPKYVENMIKYEEKDSKHRIKNSRRHSSHHRGVVKVEEKLPTYPIIHRDDIEIETLKYYDIAYERAEHDRDYIVLLEELTHEETDVLFSHTKKIRKERKKRHNSLLPALEGPKQPEYAFVRRRSQTRGGGERSRSRVRDKSPMRERMAEAIIRRS